MAAWIAMRDAMCDATRDTVTSIVSTRRSYATGRVILCGLVLITSLGCGSDATGPAPRDLSSSYWSLRLNQHAINLALQAPYNTVQLTATPLTIAGTPVQGADMVQYRTLDSTAAVDSLGHVIARYATLGQPARILASLTVQSVTLVDTAIIQVDSEPLAHPLASLSIHPVPPRCRNSAWDAPFVLSAYATDAAGGTLRNDSIANIQVYFTSSDPIIASINSTSGFVSANGPGTVTFTANTVVDGVSKQDTLAFVFGPSHTDSVLTLFHTASGNPTPTMTFSPPSVTIGAGWNLWFFNPTKDTVDVVFTDSVHAVNGSVAARDANDGTGTLLPGILTEVFHDAGTYAYHSDLFGTGGTVTVKCGI